MSEIQTSTIRIANQDSPLALLEETQEKFAALAADAVALAVRRDVHPIDILNVGVATLKELLAKDAKRAADIDLKTRAVDALGLFDAVIAQELSAKSLRGIVALTDQAESDRFINAAIDILKCIIDIDEAGPNVVAKEVAEWSRKFVLLACCENPPTRPISHSRSKSFVAAMRSAPSPPENDANPHFGTRRGTRTVWI